MNGIGASVVLAEALFLSLIPLVPVSQVIDAEDPRPAAARAKESPAPHAAAAPSPAPVQEFALYYLAGLAAPTGITGVEGVQRLGGMAEISGGFGIGFTAAQVPHARPDQVLQWAVMPRLRLGNDRAAFTAGAGVSGGNYGTLDLCVADACGAGNPASYFLWSNLEIGYERWGETGFARRVFLGWAHGWCVSAPCTTTASRDLPYFGFGLGYAF